MSPRWFLFEISQIFEPLFSTKQNVRIVFVQPCARQNVKYLSRVLFDRQFYTCNKQRHSVMLKSDIKHNKFSNEILKHKQITQIEGLVQSYLNCLYVILGYISFAPSPQNKVTEEIHTPSIS